MKHVLISNLVSGIIAGVIYGFMDARDGEPLRGVIIGAVVFGLIVFVVAFVIGRLFMARSTRE